MGRGSTAQWFEGSGLAQDLCGPFLNLGG
jgi:hypothetical protein